ncbi:MAG: leucine-rich repeat protein [Bacteroidetes bacterium]|nr:leucine-rich repeat protein [Bacteroidota bacterium]MCL1968072.1 leucine-rich repeat protein [Bacteroidota bacterium]
MKIRIILFAAVMLLGMADVFAQLGGTTGSLTWKFEANTNTLTISGEGDMPNYSDYEVHFAPWYIARNDIHNVVIETGVTSIGNRAFYYCEKMTSISIPNTVTKIGNKAFCFCFEVPFINIPDNVISIGNMVCYACSKLTVFNVTPNVTNIGNSAFDYCTSLLSFNVAGENNNYASENGVLFDKNKTTLIRYPEGKEGAYNIPNNVKSIDDGAFLNCRHLTSVTIPNSVTIIKNKVFYYCNTLTSMNIPNSVKDIGDETFSFCTNLISVILPNGITRIGNATFMNCMNLTSIIIPNCVTKIEASAFFGCVNLTSVTIPCSVASFENRSFAACYKLSLIINLNPKPVSISPCVFGSNVSCYPPDFDSCTLRVPTSAVLAYQSDYVWNMFIIEGDGISVNPKANNSEYGYTTGNGLYETGSIATVTATAYEHCRFLNWTRNGEEVSSHNLYSFSVTEDIELVANFENDGTGITTLEIPAINIYPNPTTGEFKVQNLKFKIQSVEIFDVYGRLQSHSSLVTRHENGEAVMDISELPAGIYFVKITTEKGVVMRKVVKR